MLTRRLFLSALLCAPATVFAAEDGILGDILGGITDRALRDYVGQHFGDARWDGRYYNYDDHRYTRDEWRRYLEERYRWERNGGFRRVRDDDDWDDDDDDDRRRRRGDSDDWDDDWDDDEPWDDDDDDDDDWDDDDDDDDDRRRRRRPRRYRDDDDDDD